MEQMSKGRPFKTVGPVKEKDLSPKVILFLVGTRRAKLSEDERSRREGVYICSNSDRYYHRVTVPCPTLVVNTSPVSCKYTHCLDNPFRPVTTAVCGPRERCPVRDPVLMRQKDDIWNSQTSLSLQPLKHACFSRTTECHASRDSLYVRAPDS